MLLQSSEIFNQEIVTYILQHRSTQSRFEIDRALLKQYYLGHEIEHSWQLINELHKVEPNPGIVSYIRWRESTLTRPEIQEKLLESGHSLYEIEVAWKAVENNWQPANLARSNRNQTPRWLRSAFLAANSLTVILALLSFFLPWRAFPGFYFREGTLSYYNKFDNYSSAFGLNPLMFYPFGILLVVMGLNVTDLLMPSLATKHATLLSIAHFALLSSVMFCYFIIFKWAVANIHGDGAALFGYGLFFAIVSNGWSIKNEGFGLWSTIRYFLVLFFFIPVIAIGQIYTLYS